MLSSSDETSTPKSSAMATLRSCTEKWNMPKMFQPHRQNSKIRLGIRVIEFANGHKTREEESWAVVPNVPGETQRCRRFNSTFGWRNQEYQSQCALGIRFFFIDWPSSSLVLTWTKTLRGGRSACSQACFKILWPVREKPRHTLFSSFAHFTLSTVSTAYKFGTDLTNLKQFVPKEKRVFFSKSSFWF